MLLLAPVVVAALTNVPYRHNAQLGILYGKGNSQNYPKSLFVNAFINVEIILLQLGSECSLLLIKSDILHSTGSNRTVVLTEAKGSNRITLNELWCFCMPLIGSSPFQKRKSIRNLSAGTRGNWLFNPISPGSLNIFSTPSVALLPFNQTKPNLVW